MNQKKKPKGAPQVVVIADIDTNATSLVEDVLRPAGIKAWTEGEETPEPDLLVVDITQSMGDPLAGLRTRRSNGDDTPALILAARFPQSRLRDFFRLGVADVLLKPYRTEDLIEAISDLAESRSKERTTQILSRKLESSRENIRQRSEEIRLLSEIGRTVVNLADLDRILARVTEAAAFVSDAEEAHIYLVDPDSNELALRASKQAGDANATLQMLRVNDTVVGQVFRSGQPVLQQASNETGPVKIQTGFLVRSLINVPIRAQKEVIGVLGVYNRLASRPFTEHHLTLVSALADWAGVALDHTALLQIVENSSNANSEERTISTQPFPVREALERLDMVLKDETLSLSETQLGALEGLKLTLMRGIASTPLMPFKKEVEIKYINLSEIIEEAVDEWSETAEEHNLELSQGPTLSIDPFEGDPKPVQQIVSNLVGAALHRTKEGRILINLHRFEVEDGDADGFSHPPHLSLPDGLWIAVTVADTSPGMSDSMIKALTSKEIDPSVGYGGAGLSMGELRLITKSIGASLWHDQTPEGTTMIFAIPVA
jgi:signal transduction histidine kinase